MSNKYRSHCILNMAFMMLSLMLALQVVYAQTGNDLWDAYKANPDNHPNIPNCSYAGYRTGNVSLPNPSNTIYNVKNAPYNAAGNNTTDDAASIQAAIDAAGAAGGGIVLIPEGTYLLNNFLHIKYNNVVVRGAGRDLTTLNFNKSLQTIKGDFFTTATGYNWWWSGGLVWIGPANTFDGSGKVILPEDRAQSWEYWRGGSPITSVSGTPTRGTKTIVVANGSGLSAGMKVVMVWDNPADKSLLKHIYGHAPTEGAFDTGENIGDCSGLVNPKYATFKWTVEIASVSGNQVTLVQPLRIDVRPNWNVRFEQLGSVITESGIENLRIKGHTQLTYDHLPKPTGSIGGWNGVYVNRSWNCWVRNVAVTSMENGVILSAAKNVTVTHVLIDGQQQNHHSMACRVASHDNLFEDFEVNGPRLVRHGVNTEWLSSGNVWSRGLQKVGTFDTHRALSFDLIRTECTVANNNGSGPGGAGDVGPYIGRRGTHWNILEYIDSNYDQVDGTSRNGDDIHEPRQLTMGALVGVRGKPLNTTEGEAMPIGDKGTIIADDGLTPSILNLYEAQKNFRIGALSTPPVTSVTSPANNATFSAGSNITINATASDADGTVTKVEFYYNGNKIGEDAGSPYSIVWNNVAAGKYSLTTKAIANDGATITSTPISITVTPPLRIPENPTNTINGLSYGFYLGNWGSLPDFNSLSPSKTGTVATFDLTPKTASNQFGFKYTGYISVPTDGVYSFYTSSDDGSKLYIGNTEVVDNDGAHAALERSGTIGLKAGKHAITVTFFDQVGGEVLTVSYSGPGITKAVIPSTVLYIVNGNTAPSVGIISPATNSVFTLGSTIALNANASDADGTISNVEFYQGSTKLGEDASSPYSLSWIPATAGTYLITAKATDNGGISTTSSVITLQVNEAASGVVVYSINAGSTASYKSSDGTTYSADTKFTGGNTSKSTGDIANTVDDTLYQTVRYGNFSYALPVSISGNYDVTLKFNETYWTGNGKRIFNVKAEGITIVSALDIFRTVGGKNVAYDVVTTVPVTDGTLNLEFITLTDNATVSAILVKSTSGARMSTPEEKANRDEVIVGPNPATNTIYVTGRDIENVVLYDQQGIEIIRSTSNYEALDISGIPPGIFLIKVNTSKAIHVKKILKE